MTRQVFYRSRRIPFSMAGSWVKIFDRFGKVFFAVVAGFILISEVLVHSTERFYAMILTGSTGIIATVLVNDLLKAVFKKHRPGGKVLATNNLLEPLVKYSFPSFHAQIAFTMTFIASWFAYGIHWIFIPVLIVLAFLTSYTRYVIRAHDISDIAGGALIGLGMAIPICFLLHTTNSKAISLVVLSIAVITFLYIPQKEFFRRKE